jgi:hypothetical protein
MLSCGMARPFRLTAPEPDELEIHTHCAKVLDALLQAPAIWACYPAGHVELAPAQLARLKRVGLKRGWPDVLIIYEGLTFGIEIKARGGKLSKTRIGRSKRGGLQVFEGQEDVFARLMAAGVSIAVVHGVDEMLAAIRNWGIPVKDEVQPYRRAS